MKRQLFSPSYLAILLLISYISVQAQSTGKIEGLVTDKTTGAPLEGAQVHVEGTGLGNISGPGGKFFVLNVPPGLREVTFSFTGYSPVRVEGIRIQAGHTATVNTVLETQVFELEAIVFEAETEPLIPRDNVQTKQRLPNDFSSSMPVNNVDDALGLKAGVVQDPGGKFSIRGGRVGEEAVYVDGILVKAYGEQAYASDRISSDNTPLVIGKNAVEEVNVITGGFNAEYGQAQSGVINIISREGSTEYSGSVQFISDALMPESSDYGYNELSASFGGPVSLPGAANFYTSMELKGMADATPSYDAGFRGIDSNFLGRLNGYLETLGFYDANSVTAQRVGFLDANSALEGIQQLDRYSFANVSWADVDGLPGERIFTPGDSYESGERIISEDGVYENPQQARLPGNAADIYSLSGKFTWYIGSRVKLLTSYQGSRNQRQYYQHANLFNAPERRNSAERVATTNLIGGLDWTVSQDASHSANLIFRANYYHTTQNGGALTVSSYDRSTIMGAFGFSSLEFVSEGRTAYDDIYQVGEGYEPEGDIYPTYNSGYFNPFASTFTPLPGQRGQENVSNPQQLFNESGLPLRLRNDEEERITLKADFDTQLNPENRAKFGVELQEMSVSSRNFFYVGGPLQDSWEVDPTIVAAYAQNRLDLGDLVLDAGVRLDYFDPAASFPTVIGEALPDDPRYAADKQLKVSPRVEVGFPVTEKTQLRLSYGVFAQVPSLADYYSLSGRDIQQDLASDNVNNYFGNGQLDMPQTTAFEAGISWILSDEMYLDFVGYNRDIRGNIAYRWLTPGQLLDLGGVSDRDNTRFGKNLFVATNQDHGNIKGFDLSLNKRMSNFWSMYASYSLGFARTSASDPQEFARAYGKQIIRDPISGRDTNPDPPSEQTPTDYDQTHTLNLQLNFEIPGDFYGDYWWGRALANSGASLNWHYHTGRPYTIVDIDGELATSENNQGRTASVQYTNLRITRRFTIAGSNRLSLFAEVMNLFNRKNINSLMVNPTTGKVGVDAYLLTELQQEIAGFTRMPESLTVQEVADQSPEFSSNPAERLIIASVRDLDGDGLVEFPETYALQLAALLASTDNPRAYMQPRQIRIGLRYNY